MKKAVALRKGRPPDFLWESLFVKTHRALSKAVVPLLLVDDDAVAIDSALDGDAEQGVVPDFAVVGAAGRAHGAAAGEGQDEGGDGGEKSEFLHVFLLLLIMFHAC